MRSCSIWSTSPWSASCPISSHASLFAGVRVGLDVGHRAQEVVDADRRLRGVLDRPFLVLHRPHQQGQRVEVLRYLGGRLDRAVFFKAQADEHFHGRLAQRQAVGLWPRAQRLALHAAVALADAGVLVLHPVVDAPVLDEHEDVRGKPPVAEQIEEALEVDAGAAVAIALTKNGPLLFGSEDRGRLVELKAEAPELQVCYLVGRDDLEPRKVLVLRGVPLHKRREEDVVALRRGIVGRRPADSLALELVGGPQLDPLAGEGAAVHGEDFVHPREVEPRRQVFDGPLRTARFEAEEGEAAVLVLVEDPQPRIEPSLKPLAAQPVHHHRRVLDELSYRGGRVGREAVGHVEERGRASPGAPRQGPRKPPRGM